MNGARETKTVVKLFLVWQDEDEERWLEQMSREGWHLKRGGIVFRFVKGAPSQTRYRLDYLRGVGRKLEEYFTLFADSGWEHVCSFANWHYFRSNDAAAPEVFTDTESRAAKYRRVLTVLVAVLCLNLLQLFTHSARERAAAHGYGWVIVVWGSVLLLLTYAVVRTWLRIRRLRRQSEGF